jgi:hypothetical protein
MTLSILPWWGWLICSVLCYDLYTVTDDKESQQLVSLLSAIAGLITGGIAIICVAKWVVAWLAVRP